MDKSGRDNEPQTDAAVPGERKEGADGVETDLAIPKPPARSSTMPPIEAGEDVDGDELPRDAPDETLQTEEVRWAVLDDVRAYFADATADEVVPGSADGEQTTDGTVADLALPSEAFIEEQWFDFGYLDRYEEVERYWVDLPYAYVSILYNPETHTHRYHVSQPMLDDFEKYARDDLIRILRNSLMYEDLPQDTERTAVFRRKAVDIVTEHAATVEPGSVNKLLYYLLGEFVGFGKIDPMMQDRNIEDISCDGDDVPVFVYHRFFRDLKSNVNFSERRLNSFVVRLAHRSGKHMSISDPLIDASLDDGSRIQLTLGGDISSRGSNFTVRKFSDVPLTPVDMVRWNTFSADMMAYYWLAIENGKSLIFAGGTGSGKTSSLNAVSFFVPPDSKVVSIEDTREITLPHDNWIQSVARRPIVSGGQGEVSTFELLQASLRQRPEYILVGEIRTEQRVAQTFFQAIGTGHTCYTTLHADSAESALSRLQNPPLGVPAQMIQDLDIISVQKQIFHDRRRVRRTHSVTEVLPGDSPETIGMDTLYEREAETDTYRTVGDSRVLEDIRDQRGWSEERLDEEFDARRDLLEYMVEVDITAHRDVAAVIKTFARDRTFVMEQVEADALDPSSFPEE